MALPARLRGAGAAAVPAGLGLRRRALVALRAPSSIRPVACWATCAGEPHPRPPDRPQPAGRAARCSRCSPILLRCRWPPAWWPTTRSPHRAAEPLRRRARPVSLATGWHKTRGQWIVIALVVLHVLAVLFYVLRRSARTWSRPMIARRQAGRRTAAPRRRRDDAGSRAAGAARSFAAVRGLRGRGSRRCGGMSLATRLSRPLPLAGHAARSCSITPDAARSELEATRAIFREYARRAGRRPVLPELRRRAGQAARRLRGAARRAAAGAASTASSPAAARCGRWTPPTTPTPAR